MSSNSPSRRDALALAAAGAALVVPATAARAAGKEMEVTANEDLMREHGILRRALLVYREAGRRALHEPSRIPLRALHKTALLFRRFGEDYHERTLEEVHIFPTVRKLRGVARSLPDILQAQHERGRAITDSILDLSSRAKFPAKDAAAFAAMMDALVLMFDHHTAREDTILFPAWKEAIGANAYAEMGEHFEEIEHKTFGHDGFDDGVKQMAGIEAEFRLADLSKLTAPLPPPL